MESIDQETNNRTSSRLLRLSSQTPLSPPQWQRVAFLPCRISFYCPLKKPEAGDHILIVGDVVDGHRIDGELHPRVVELAYGRSVVGLEGDLARAILWSPSGGPGI